mgnify:CR=1 FL=1
MIKSIGSTLLILSPWNDPVLLRRVWCLFEVYNALETSAELHIQVPRSERQALADAVVLDSDCLIQKLSNIRIEKAEATIASDKDLILKVIQNSEGGYYRVSKQVKDRLRAWYMEQLDELVSESPDNHYLRVITAEICSSFGSVDKALELASQGQASLDIAVKLKSHSVTGRIYAAQNKFDQALENYKEALTVLSQEFKGLECDIGFLYMDQGFAQYHKFEIGPAMDSFSKGIAIVMRFIERNLVSGCEDDCNSENDSPIDMHNVTTAGHNSSIILPYDRCTMDEFNRISGAGLHRNDSRCNLFDDR